MAVWPDARRLRQPVDGGGDPCTDREAHQASPTVASVVQRYRTKHLPGQRPRSRAADEPLLEQWIATVTMANGEVLHDTARPILAVA
jgi:hypothetical protein